METRIIILFMLLCFASVASAIVIFPAFAAPYVSSVYFPIAPIFALGTEYVIYKWRNQSLTFGVILLLLIGVNVISTVAGIIITSSLPDGLTTNSSGVLTGGPEFMLYAKLGFVLAYVLSVIIEWVALLIAAKKIDITSTFKLSLLSNTASYIILTVIVWLMLKTI